MKRLPVLLAACLFVFPIAAQSEKPNCLPCRGPEKTEPMLPETWQPIEISGQIEFVIGEKDGKPFLRLPVILKDGILYKLHLPIPFLKEENIRSGETVTVTGKGRPSFWTKDRSVSVIVFSVETGGVKKEIPHCFP